MATQTLKPQTEKRTILPDTSLCAIVRDEIINPAQLPGKSGIRSFVESHVPYVEQAVIVDTGSVDGTRQELEQLAAEFPNLRVYDRPFDNYASARNHSLALVPTKRALVLDVDELLGAGSIAELSALLSKYSPQFLHMVIRKIFANGKTETGWGWNTRLFENNNVQFRRIAEITGDTFETWTESLFSIEYNRWAEDILDAPRAISYPPKVEILHFKPSGGNAASTMKMKNWYRNPQGFSEPPSQREGFKYWKQPNSHREKFK